MAGLNVRLCNGITGSTGARTHAASLPLKSRSLPQVSGARHKLQKAPAAAHSTRWSLRHGIHHNLRCHDERSKVACAAAVTAGDGDYRYEFDWKLKLDPALLASLGTILAVVISGISNRVLYRMALVPMKDYVFYLAQFQTFGYVVVYFSMLYFRYRSGKVTQDMLESPPRLLFLVVGACEALAQVLLMVGAAQLPGAVLPLVSQSVLLWNMLFSTSILHHRVRLTQVIGALLVIGGVLLAAMPSPSPGGTCPVISCDVRYIGLCVLSFAFPSLSSIVKERIFAEGQKRLGKPLDLFVVNSYGSAAQAFFVLLMLPLLTSLRGIPLPDLPSYLARGSQCFMGLAPTCGADCSGAPLLPILYVISNLVFNVSILKLLRMYGTVAASLSMASLVPLTIWVFSLQLPFLESAVLGPMFVLGTLILMGGLMIYNLEHYSSQLPGWMRGGSKAA